MTLKVRENGAWVAVGGGGSTPTEGWVRPADWLPLPTLTDTDRAFVGLYAIFPPDGNSLAFSFVGAYQVDWGDGSAVETFGSSTPAQHTYDYATIPSGTESSRGYRQVVVTVTPTTATWTTINLNVRPAAFTASGSTHAWLDVATAGSTLTTITLRGTVMNARMLEQYQHVGSLPMTSFVSMFNTCYSLQSVPQLDTSSGTSFASMFFGRYSLRSIPQLDTAAGTNFSSMFGSCYSLQSVPQLHTSSGTSFTSMFSGCSTLQSVPQLDTSSGATFSSMFSGCSTLQSVPQLDTSSGVTFSSMFYGCSSLRSIPPLDTSSATDFSSMFSSCSTLQIVPPLDLSAATSSSSYTSMFASNPSLSRSQVTGAKFTHSYVTARLSRDALVEIFTNLPIVTGETITITGNRGAASLTVEDRAIATNKGWTITS